MTPERPGRRDVFPYRVESPRQSTRVGALYCARSILGTNSCRMLIAGGGQQFR